MGGSFGKGKKQSKVLCVGLDNSGKSTIINKLKPDSKKASTNPFIAIPLDHTCVSVNGEWQR
jgi:ribosome biogenesis GTPase A